MHSIIRDLMSREKGGSVARFLLIVAFIITLPSVFQAQTLDAFNPNAGGTVSDMKVLPDGKILICGQFATIGGQNRRAIARLNSDGTVDSGFAIVDLAFQNLLDM